MIGQIYYPVITYLKTSKGVLIILNHIVAGCINYLEGIVLKSAFIFIQL